MSVETRVAQRGKAILRDATGEEAPLELVSEAPLADAIELRAEGLRKRYRSRVVVKDVSLEVRSGEVIGLLGPNGAGKTTCFYMIVGLVAADGGEIALDGEDLSRLAIHKRARRWIGSRDRFSPSSEMLPPSAATSPTIM